MILPCMQLVRGLSIIGVFSRFVFLNLFHDSYSWSHFNTITNDPLLSKWISGNDVFSLNSGLKVADLAPGPGDHVMDSFCVKAEKFGMRKLIEANLYSQHFSTTAMCHPHDQSDESRHTAPLQMFTLRNLKHAPWNFQSWDFQNFNADDPELCSGRADTKYSVYITEYHMAAGKDSNAGSFFLGLFTAAQRTTISAYHSGILNLDC
jgi:hypothetical protein